MAPKLGAKNSSEQSSDWFVAKDVAIVLGYTNPAKIKALTVQPWKIMSIGLS